MKTWSIMAAMLIVALSATLVMADDAPATPAPTPAKHKMNGVHGTITKIDGVNVTVQPKEGDAKTFATDDKTTVTEGTKNGDKKAVSDLAVKQTVAVKLSEDGKTAVFIIINPKMSGRRDGAAAGNATGNN